MIQQAIEKAAVLIQALPYIHQFRGETVVVKFGGSIMSNPEGCKNILNDIAFMECVGMRPVVVHGGGKSISAAMSAAGIEPNFVDGLRVTDAASIKIVEQVLNQKVNRDMVATLESLGYKARGMHGEDILRVKQYTRDGKDWGFVGEVTDVDTDAINAFINAEMVPLITPLGRDETGAIHNINADEAATAVAQKLKARKLVYLSDVPGVMRDPSDPTSIISTLTPSKVHQLMDEGVISGGMIPKVNGALKALEAGINKVHFIDSMLPHSILLELFTDEGVGTQIIRD